GQSFILKVLDRAVVEHRLNIVIKRFGSRWAVVVRPKARFFVGNIIAGENADLVQSRTAIGQGVTGGVSELLWRLRINISRHPSFGCHSDFLSFVSLRRGWVTKR